jgi:quinol-cytochrome oxidoreductase complex cytochrome b subunit
VGKRAAERRRGVRTSSQEIPVNSLIRQTHRWLSIAFTLGVVTNLVVYSIVGKAHPPPFWVNLLALVPVFLLLFSGLYLFALPYVARSKRATA